MSISGDTSVVMDCYMSWVYLFTVIVYPLLKYRYAIYHVMWMCAWSRSEVRFQHKKANSITFQRFHSLALDLQNSVQVHSSEGATPFHNRQSHSQNSHSGSGADEWRITTTRGRGKKHSSVPVAHPANGDGAGKSVARVDLMHIFEEYFREEVSLMCKLQALLDMAKVAMSLVLSITLKYLVYNNTVCTDICCLI